MKPACVSLRRARPLLGTFVEIAAAGAGRPALEGAVEAAFAVVSEVHRLMSVQDPESDLGRLNREAAQHPVEVHPWTFAVLEAALDLQKASGGMFDIAARRSCGGALSARLRGEREGTRREGDGEGEVGVDAAPTSTRPSQPPGGGEGGFIELLGGRRVRLSHPDATIDLGGIAKGFAVDRAVAILRDQDVPQGLVNAGGDLAAFGPQAATVSLRDPRDPRRIMAHIEIKDEAAASSGPRVDPFVARETRDTAVIDPRTSRPARAAVGATVCAGRCMIADALTKIVMVAGEAAAPLLAAFGANALFVAPDGDLRVSGNWQDAVRLAA